ncbi:alkaline phosphatase D family protein [Cellulophaga sp. E6(2014)]|uniref:alkaline phosphatase D family protein n=1 Tax=Cellulophaga sp. E6(2014) TaxID=1495334 RepID=UPI00051D2489|nr:alkaline phosphatase D family protein [Cellulophaga sp. E6(2014)]KGK28768.1 alkaline phosphatase [Cellulophaga sp. E6(2014)]
MKKLPIVFNSVFILLGVVLGQAQDKSVPDARVEKADFTIAFGSCNKSTIPNVLWDDILNTHPDVWIWGGDNVYADTNDMQKLQQFYKSQDSILGYQKLRAEVPVIGTWDDHDYGLNDGGAEYTFKKESQQVFLDFFKIAKDSPRRKQEGVYVAHTYDTPEGSIKVIVLDTRYFRTALTKDTETKKRTKPNTYGEGTVLGAAQWEWLAKELNSSTADFNILVSSIQVLSNKHGFETWGNFPHEVDKLEQLIADSKAKGVVVLSGDRHISEFSKTTIVGVAYPLIDFTSSGLTHVYSSYSGEENPYRVGEVVAEVSFGTLTFNFETSHVVFKMIGDKGKVLGILEQGFK